MYGLNSEAFGDHVAPAIVDSRPPFRVGDLVRHILYATTRRVARLDRMSISGSWVCYFNPAHGLPSGSWWATDLELVEVAPRLKMTMFVTDPGFSAAVYSPKLTLGNSSRCSESTWLVPDPDSYLWRANSRNHPVLSAPPRDGYLQDGIW